MKQIRVTMLGKFTIQGTSDMPPREISLTGKARKLWILITYLIIYRERGVSPQELIDLLWPEAQNKNPLSTLQNNVSRARRLLSCKEHKTGCIIQFENGLYHWNTEWETVVDYERFDKLAKKSMNISDEEQAVEIGLEAMEIYTGEFLPEVATESWCINMNQYFSSLFLKLATFLVPLLIRQNRRIEAENLCVKGIKINPTVEEFSIMLMRCFNEGKNYQGVLDQYKYIQKEYEENYGITPSDEIEKEKTIALQNLYGEGALEQQIHQLFVESQEKKGAFFCEKNVFWQIVNLRLREGKRTKYQCKILQIQLLEENLSLEQQECYMKQMKDIIMSDLRSSDGFSRQDFTSFVVLFSGLTTANIHNVSRRIQRRYKKEFPKDQVVFKDHIYSVE